MDGAFTPGRAEQFGRREAPVDMVSPIPDAGVHMRGSTKHEIAYSYEPVSRGRILRHECGQRNIHFSCSADHVQDWQPYPVDPYSCYMCDHRYIDT